jgi:hypothetical protein
MDSHGNADADIESVGHRYIPLWVAKTSSAHEVANLQVLTGELLPRAFFTLALSNAM